MSCALLLRAGRSACVLAPSPLARLSLPPSRCYAKIPKQRKTRVQLAREHSKAAVAKRKTAALGKFKAAYDAGMRQPGDPNIVSSDHLRTIIAANQGINLDPTLRPCQKEEEGREVVGGGEEKAGSASGAVGDVTEASNAENAVSRGAEDERVIIGGVAYEKITDPEEIAAMEVTIEERMDRVMQGSVKKLLGARYHEWKDGYIKYSATDGETKRAVRLFRDAGPDEHRGAKKSTAAGLKSVNFLRSVVKTEDLPTDGWAEVAFAGRSNVGKSSLLNVLLGEKKNLVKSSSTPGHTQALNFFQLRFNLSCIDQVPEAVVESMRERQEMERGQDLVVHDDLSQQELEHPMTSSEAEQFFLEDQEEAIAGVQDEEEAEDELERGDRESEEDGDKRKREAEEAEGWSGVGGEIDGKTVTTIDWDALQQKSEAEERKEDDKRSGMYFVDMPGYGYTKAPKEVSHQWRELMEAYLTERRALCRVFVLIDSRHGLQENDREFFDMLDSRFVTYQVVLTKADKVKPNSLLKLMHAVQQELRLRGTASPWVLSSSAKSKHGLEDIKVAVATGIGAIVSEHSF